MFNFNGNVTFSNVTINGRTINGSGFVPGETKTFDERKSEVGNNVERIIIDSTFVAVNISSSNSSNVEAHFYGQATIDGDIDFDVYTVNRELRITLQFTGNCCNSNLKLDVTVPQKTFKSITAKSLSANITLSEDVSTDYLKMKTTSGNLETSATFTNASISTTSGYVDLYINAKSDISIEISATSGNVSAEFNNIGYIDLSTSCISGSVRNRHKGDVGYAANVDISTISGNIQIR